MMDLHHLLQRQAALLAKALHQAHQTAAAAATAVEHVKMLRLARTAARKRRHGAIALHHG